MVNEEEMNAIQSKHTEESPYVGIIEEFLNTPIPKNWQDMSIGERRDFYKFGDASISEQSSELVQRDKVCALEIFVECFGKDKGDSRGSMELKKITNALRQLGTWQVYDGNQQGKLRFGKEYGLQKAYIRDEDINDLI